MKNYWLTLLNDEARLDNLGKLHDFTWVCVCIKDKIPHWQITLREGGALLLSQNTLHHLRDHDFDILTFEII